MAIARAGGVVDAISGNIGAINCAQTRNGLVIRRRLTRSDSATSSQLFRRTIIPALHRRWVFLTDDQRTTWTTAAREFNTTNRLGVTSQLSGVQLFLRVNAGYPTAPAVYYVNPPDMISSEVPTGLSLTAQQGAAITLTFSGIDNDAFNWLILEGSAPQSINPRAHFGYWKIFYAKTNNASPLAITADWLATMGTHRSPSIIAVRITHRWTRRLPSVPIVLTATVAAP